MSLASLKVRMADISGIEKLSMELLAGRQNYSLGGRLISVDSAASDADVERAVRASLSSPAIAQLPAGTPAGAQAAPSASLLPAVNPQLRQESKPMTTAGTGGFAASIKAMMNDALAGMAQAQVEGLARIQHSVGKLNEAKTATMQVAESMAKSIDDQTAAVLSELGQISNDLGGQGK